jgi:hypothetical protein
MKRKRQLILLGLLAGAVILGSAAAGPERRYKNLKVLPRHISSKELQGIMTDDFEDGLGVSCGFCHAPAAGGHGLDFVSDAKPEKEIARAMMRMTLGLNKKYFKLKRPMFGTPTPGASTSGTPMPGAQGLTITCATCHKGQPFPDANEQQ